DGAVRTMVGGRTYQDSQFNRATQALRQPGSAFKPFVYLAGLQAGLTPDSLVEDAPLQIGQWQPANFDNEYRGTVTLQDALAFSLNTAAVRVLDMAGTGRVQDVARALGITSPLGHDLSLALGTSEVTLLELTGAYAGLANVGGRITPWGIQEIRNAEGKILYRYRDLEPLPVLPENQVATLNRMMTGVLAWGTGHAAAFDHPAAGKTGTSQDYRDAWFVGFTDDLVTGVWMGNDDNSPMKKVSGGGLPARLWHDFMAAAHAGLPVRPVPGTGDTLAPDVIDPSQPQPLQVDATSPARVPATETAIGQLENLLGRIIGTE
ncbi:MAG: penicillin-binding transpeptidase domain-containing protein, partial [Pseudomonadota bacterium]|nr:penicillin-binding transpeptidase domain-containing protein [Pseudomonadota bacterium]